MIYVLRKKFILISAASIFFVLFAICTIIFVSNRTLLNHTIDALTDVIAENNGVFPSSENSEWTPPADHNRYDNVITEETAFSTRFFTAWIGDDHQITKVNVDYVFSISEEQVQKYAETAQAKHTKRGWVENYRFKVFDSDGETAIVFVNGEMFRMMSNHFLLTALLILTGIGFVILILIIITSKWVVCPIAESYEKQKQFITDANHELKTPLTLILSDLDIVESEFGQNEWLDDMRIEGEQMKKLINQLVTLSRMDEDRSNLSVLPFDLSNAAMDVVSEFQSLAAKRNKKLTSQIEASIEYNGDEGMIRRLLSILLDNAIKYCDEGGEIMVSVYKKRYPVILVENTYCGVDTLELERLFDRFYRADKARTYDGSFGVGLSIAKAIARNHHGDISAYKKRQIVGFRVELK